VVRRFVVDECHQVITCDSYRQKFNAVKELAQYPVQKIFITATLPVFLEDYFLQQVYLPRSTPVIREPTNRTNIIYHLLRVEQRVRKAKDVIVDLAKLVERDLWNVSSRGIIFCLSRGDVDELAPLFGNTKSHSDMESSDRLELQEKWNEGHHGHHWMVATTGFIHGIDNPNVDTVIFLEMPYGLNNFVQGGGRAGRSGRPAHVFLLDYCSTFMRPTIGVDSNAIVAGCDFVGNVSECRRGILSEVMDGVRVCCGDLIDAEKCDLCNPSNPMVVASKKLLQPVRDDSPVYDEGGWDDATLASIDLSTLDSTPISSSMTLASSPSQLNPSTSLLLDQAIYLKLKNDKIAKVLELTSLTKAVSGLQDGSHVKYCVICWVWKQKHQKKTPDHQYFISCMSRDDGYIRHGFGWIQLKKKFKYEKYHYCWKCGLPQGKFALATHPVFRTGTVLNCPFDDLIALLIWHIIHTEDIWTRACASFLGIESNMSLEKITDWLIKEEQPHLFYNGLELVVWFWIAYKDTLP
jgi:Helicase conserved C-terminal domain